MLSWSIFHVDVLVQTLLYVFHSNITLYAGRGASSKGEQEDAQIRDHCQLLRALFAPIRLLVI